MMSTKFFRILSISMLFLATLTVPALSHAREGKSVSIIGLGNLMLIQTDPELDPGPGGGISFEYGFNDRFSLEASVFVSTHNGQDNSNGDDDILFMGIPTVDVHYHLLSSESNWDPYAGVGLGVYALTEGSADNGSGGLGLGGQIVLGFDYYFSERFSAGFNGTFRSAAIITGLDDNNGNDNATAILPYTLAAKFGFHF